MLADLLILVFGPRSCREAYRAHTQAIRELTEARREARHGS